MSAIFYLIFFHWIWHRSQCCSHDDRNCFCLSLLPTSWVFLQPIAHFFGCLVFFSAGTELCSSMISGLSSGTVLSVWICWSYTTRPAVLTDCTIPRLVYPYPNEDIDKFYCAFLDIHVLLISNNRKSRINCFRLKLANSTHVILVDLMNRHLVSLVSWTNAFVS